MRHHSIQSKAAAYITAAILIVATLTGGINRALTPILLAGAQTGKISGTVVENKTGKPLPYANVIIVGTKYGAMTLEDGSFLIAAVPAGRYTVKVMMMGYRIEEKKEVEVVAGKTVKIEFRLQEEIVGQTQEIIVGGEMKMVEVKDSDRQFFGKPTKDMALGGGIIRRPYPPAEYNTEEYEHINDNRFLGVIANPLSTFSIDVDVASYANMRRFINNNQYPYKDAIRIEELINYFDYDYEKPGKGEPFSINLELSECPWNRDHRLVHIGLRGEELDEKDRRPSNLVFLLDVSGSMDQPSKLPLLKDAFRLLVNQLGQDDQVAIVVYAGTAGLVLPSTRGSQKEKILEALDRLRAGGSTAGGEGIRLAYEVARENLIKDGNNRIILATDGDFNVGISSSSELIEFIEKKRDDGIFLTVLGFGMGNYKDHRLEQLADKGNGNHAYIDNIMEAKKVLVNDITATLYTIAKDVKIQVEFNPAKVAEYRLIGYENRMLETEDFEDDTKDAGEIGAGHTVTALYEIVPGPDGEGEIEDNLKYQDVVISKNAKKSGELLTVNIRYKEPLGDKSRLISKVLKDDPVSLGRSSNNFRFSAAVAMFGMILRESEYRGSADLDSVLELARGAKGDDRYEYRSEFIRLVNLAKVIAELRDDGSKPETGEKNK
ncbi:MAG: von Willebrand factor type A domain-containing protein [Candidatus Krumholzibacteriota bacterium]|nr:von Willebrand factor type A domain-containing protein [Candidatus Krumholzibacteriota bacterium]